MEEVTLLGVVDTYGIELLHPIREGRSPHQVGRKGISNHRWIVGLKLGVLLNRWGLVVGWVWAPANTADVHFQVLADAVRDRMLVLSDTGFHAATGDPDNLKVCRRGEWNDRMVVETVLSMLTTLSHLKKGFCCVSGGGFDFGKLRAHPTSCQRTRMIDFKGHRFEKDIILLCVRWYLAYPLSYRNLEEMMEERGVEVDHSNLYRWVQKFTPTLEIIGALLEAACNSSGISPARAPVSDHA